VVTARHLSLVLVVCICAVLAPLTVRADAASTYVVREGDTLWTIARRMNVGVQELLSANHLAATSAIHPGQQLIVPDAPGPSVSAPAVSRADARTYVVRPGDTLSGIAVRLGTSVQSLAAANRLPVASRIWPGETLGVPGAAPAAQTAPTMGPTRVSEASVHRAAAPAVTSPAASVPAWSASRMASTPVRTALPSRGVAFTSAVVRNALRYLGRPYQWAGMGNRGFDCSGLVARVFAAVGLALPHSSFGQFHIGIDVPRWALSPGDLVFFHTYGYGASHVGIYLGANRFIHASTDRGVTVSSMSDPYYYVRYLGARRI